MTGVQTCALPISPGPRTIARIKAFQADNGLEVDGVVGPLTAAALNAAAFQSAKGERANAVRWALSKVGTTEHPPGSNQGPGITQWQEESGFPGAGVAWCQVFASQTAKQGSRNRIKPIWFGGYTPSVCQMAAQGEHDLKRVHLNEARPGDWIYLSFGESSDFCDHVAVFLSRNADGSINTVEGNTSAPSGSGSQSNGGGVFKRVRSASLVVATVRVPFKS